MDKNKNKNQSSGNRREYVELGRVKLSDAVEVVVSEIKREGKLTDYNINRHLDIEGYNGFVKGQEIPSDKIVPFLKVFPKNLLQAALEGK